MIFVCQVKNGAEWTDRDIDAALKSAGEDMRCPACGGRVFAHKAYSNGTAAHFEHQEKHKGCSLSGYLFAPPATTHPNPLK
jgi:DNA-directed RNA polymerase subunit RPC12/RpoP